MYIMYVQARQLKHKKGNVESVHAFRHFNIDRILDFISTIKEKKKFQKSETTGIFKF